MTEQTHTPYQRGRRAAERGAPRKVPADVDFGTYRGEWLEGFDSIHGTPATRGAHYQGGQFQAWDVTRYLSGDMAQAWQYVYRCGRKGSEQDAVTDLRKAVDFIEDWLAHDPEPNQRASTGDIPDEVFFTLDQWRLFALNDIQYADHNGAADTAEHAVKTIKREIARREAA
ncbi:hypothetical protein [Komagataeibacter europaeus]|uniref:hypothetical protein n=1 Tax=Komagataeibacter europaeus TaxID=33995 RepID=UPI00036D8949|nr:hypothetical protein [Komagataeibacter europaeus]GBQ44977.1 hypothetical protein AA18890_2331 [Komagataeibacter europaeus LMG 18890]